MDEHQQKALFLLENPIKEYNWGHPTILPTLLHYENPNHIPQAELWMGAHPQSPSTVCIDGESIALTQLLADNAKTFLGPNYGNTLPFLFKILAIQTPLSLQVHPAKELAEAGFMRENTQGIALDDAKRTYKDNNDKTELLCAYSDDVWALVGFRNYHQSIADLQSINSSALGQLLQPFSANPNACTLEAFLTALLTIDDESKQHIITDTLAHLQQLNNPDNRWQWVAKLHQHYANDIAILAPLYMNLIHLPKGHSVFVTSGTLHAYLQGTGIEVMAASDNVVRFGLTQKYVDLESLSHVVSFHSEEPLILTPNTHQKPLTTPPCSFLFSHLSAPQQYHLTKDNPPQIILALKEPAVIHNTTLNLSYHLNQGQAIFVPYAAGDYHINSKGDIFIASAYQ